MHTKQVYHPKALAHGKRKVLTAASTAALLAAASFSAPGVLYAQGTQQEQTNDAIDEVMVTGSRIARTDGYEAPTALTVVGVDDLQSSATPNIADYLNTMPAFSGSDSPASSQVSASSGTSNLNALNLRGLGPKRTLVLLDGQRTVGATLSGLVDVNLMPQALVERVEVVTGGASAVYGSDAIGGVVNFILDKDFTGFKADASLGGPDSEGGDGYKASLSWGVPFANDRGHLIVSGALRHTDGNPINTRSWNLKGWGMMTNPNYTPTNGEPERLVLPETALSDGIAGGIITDTALRGTAFGPGGTPYQFNYGDLVYDPDMRGGDWKKADARPTRAGESLGSEIDNYSLFTRVSYDLTDNVQVFAQASMVNDDNYNWAYTMEDNGSINIQAGNPFIPASVVTAMQVAGVTEFNMGNMHPDLGVIAGDNEREIKRYVIGASGSFDALGSEWNWDGYYQAGRSESHQRSPNVVAYPNWPMALDAVTDPVSGTPVCRSTLTDPTNGCVPYNPMGIGVNTQAAVDYVTGQGISMFRKENFEQDVVAVSMSGEPFSTWAGPVSVAFGAEYREESVSGVNDEISRRFDWWTGGYSVTEGGLNVTEGFLETIVPLATDLPWAESLDLSAAVRETDYSTFGNVTTWKIGASYLPVEDVRFRVTRSRDIRAPNLEELISKGSGGVAGVVNPFDGNSSQSVKSHRVGNPNLTPEIGDGLGVGVVFQPRFLPDFTASVDYWSLDIEDAISLTSTQDIIDRCFQGNQNFCDLITFVPGTNVLESIPRSPVNFVTQEASGLDIEATYMFPLTKGVLTANVLATHYIENKSSDGVTPTRDTVGENSGDGPPDWRWSASLNYDLDPMNFTLTARGISSGVYDNRFIECASGCPASTPEHRTINTNHISGQVFYDASFRYSTELAGAGMDLYVNVRNLFDSDPVVVARGPGGYAYTRSPANPTLYDVLGRVIMVGARLSFD